MTQIGAINQENETNKASISELNGQIEDIIDRYKILQDSIDNAPKPTAVSFSNFDFDSLYSSSMWV